MYGLFSMGDPTEAKTCRSSRADTTRLFFLGTRRRERGTWEGEKKKEGKQASCQSKKKMCVEELNVTCFCSLPPKAKVYVYVYHPNVDNCVFVLCVRFCSACHTKYTVGSAVQWLEVACNYLAVLYSMVVCRVLPFTPSNSLCLCRAEGVY